MTRKSVRLAGATLPRPTISPRSFTTSAQTQPSFSGLNPIRGGHGTRRGSGCNGNGRRCCADDSSYLHRRRTLSGRLPQRRRVDGHLSQPLSGCREDRVGDSGDDRRGPWFAHSTWRLRILDDVNLDGRRLVHAENLVRMEVGLLHTAVLERDLTIERRSDAEDDRALNLRLDCVGIDDGAAIDRADDPADTNRAILRYFNFGNLRHMG